ncbi:DUF2637 domain-containing protein [Streptantibioticus silvisoli]|uniref:DUF2637 domain-containing protein n=1 Tax=Streptantibioticus silvisoli TaxID=2705255 RepID=A0ABT6W5Y4_9ACTN|nr:DUF2637 domain-containing protein [Streptantibioticus silvisoli]MDI5966165.1 DUF2637 domain-containing protein [Streptantibioticus silvisoli]
MRHGGRPDPGEEWDARATPYDGRRGTGYGGRALPDYEAYETLSYEPTAYEPTAYEQRVYETRAYESRGYEPAPYDATGYEATGYEALSYDGETYPGVSYEGTGYETGAYTGGYDAGAGPGGYPAMDETPAYGVAAAGAAGGYPGGPGPRIADPGMDAAEAETYGPSWEFEEGLARLLQTSAPESVPPRIPRQRFAHRRQSKRLARAWRRVRRLVKAAGPISWLKLISLTLAALTAVVVAVVGALSGVISYDPLRRLAVPGVVGELAGFWPLLVYGPWLVASMSILRAAVHRRRAAHSWLVVVIFSAIAVYLCVAHAGRTPVRLAVAGLPPITALVCFHQLVRQITLTNPPRKGPRRPRHTARRD